MATMQPMSRIISVSDLPWEERQPGVKRKRLWEDPATQRRALMSRIEPRAQFPRHRHVGDALVFVIEGALSDEFGTITAGNMGYRPQGCIHTLATTHGATALVIIYLLVVAVSTVRFGWRSHRRPGPRQRSWVQKNSGRAGRREFVGGGHGIAPVAAFVPEASLVSLPVKRPAV